MNFVITKERPDSPESSQLIHALEATLSSHYAPENRHGYSIEKLLQQDVHFFVGRYDERPVACGGVQFYGQTYAEVKRMYVDPQYRGLGFAKALLNHLIAYTQAQHISCLRLETGIYQIEAMALYEKLGFVRISAFPPYRDDGISVCYEKHLELPAS